MILARDSLIFRKIILGQARNIEACTPLVVEQRSTSSILHSTCQLQKQIDVKLIAWTKATGHPNRLIQITLSHAFIFFLQEWFEAQRASAVSYSRPFFLFEPRCIITVQTCMGPIVGRGAHGDPIDDNQISYIWYLHDAMVAGRMRCSRYVLGRETIWQWAHGYGSKKEEYYCTRHYMYWLFGVTRFWN